jgi:hypothetical protein
MRLTNDFDLVVHFDADSIIVDRLDELLVGDYDIACVKNNNHFGKAGKIPGIWFENVGVEYYVNAGLVASTKKEFWIDWLNFTLSRDFPVYGEQDALNVLFYSGKYRAKLLDPPNKDYYYGIANSWGVDTSYENWKEIQVRPDGLYTNNKKIKVLHHAGGAHGKIRFEADLFNPETRRFIESFAGPLIEYPIPNKQKKPMPPPLRRKPRFITKRH